MNLHDYDPKLVRDSLQSSPLVQGLINNGNRKTNRRERAIARERALIRRDMRKGLNTRRVTRTLRRIGEARRNPVTFRV